MRRIWIGVGVLLALLAAGLLVMRATDRQLREVSETLKRSSETENWDEAISLAEKAQRDWKKKRQLMAALADHAELEQIEGGFAQLEAYRRYADETDHAAVCAQLSEAIRDLAESHRLTWWNLL